MRTVTILLIGLFSLPAMAGKSEDRKACTQHHRNREMDEAIKCYKRLIARGDASKDPELYRLLGAAQAIAHERMAAYRSYRLYVEKCPKCMHAPSVKKIVEDFEEWRGPFDEADKRPSSSIAVKRTAKAKALLDKAEALKKRDPGQAREMMESAARLLPKGHPLWKRVRALRAELYVGGKQ